MASETVSALDVPQTMATSGVILAFLGVLTALLPVVTMFPLEIIFGSLLVAGGIVLTALAFSSAGWPGFPLQTLTALLFAFAGVSVFTNTLINVTSITLILAFYLSFSGMSEIFKGLRIRSNPNWGWSILGGGVFILASILIGSQWPIDSAWAVGVFLGASMAVNGIALVVTGRGMNETR